MSIEVHQMNIKASISNDKSTGNQSSDASERYMDNNTSDCNKKKDRDYARIYTRINKENRER